MLRWDNDSKIRTTRHGKLVSTKRIYPDLVFHRKCQRMNYMRLLELKCGEPFSRAFRREVERYCKAGVRPCRDQESCWTMSNITTRIAVQFKRYKCQPTLQSSFHDDRLNCMHALRFLIMFQRDPLLQNVIDMAHEQNISDACI